MCVLRNSGNYKRICKAHEISVGWSISGTGRGLEAFLKMSVRAWVLPCLKLGQKGSVPVYHLKRALGPGSGVW